MDKLLRRPQKQIPPKVAGKFQKFGLIENPFPSEPIVNKDSKDKRINGDIYELEIRSRELEQILNSFIKVPQFDINHLRLGFIIDTSYIGRGNGKSAFLIHLQQIINKEYCLDITNDINKCFAIYFAPEPGGRTKTFSSLLDLFYKAILRSNIIAYCLAILRLEAIYEVYPDYTMDKNENEEAFIDKLNSADWFKERHYDIEALNKVIYRNEFLQGLPPQFPLFLGRHRFFKQFITQNDFAEYYAGFRRDKEKFEYVFSELVKFFLSAGFNGAYVLIDDFERIPDFQSERQKKDFALELRSCLYDGLFENAKIGFYNFFLVLHAGVERLISAAWAGSGMENRAPISPKTASKHIIPFEKLSREHASLLIKKYLDEYRIDQSVYDPLSPFTKEAIRVIGELSEYNAAKILKMSYDLLDKAAEIKDQKIIDEKFVHDNRGMQKDDSDKQIPTIDNADSTDLVKKAKTKE